MKKVKTAKLPQLASIAQFVFIEDVPIETVGPQVFLWERSSWWPLKSVLTFTPMDAGATDVGARYKLKIRAFGSGVHGLEVTKSIPGHFLERTFQDGALQGFETVKVEERSNGTRVDYVLNYYVRGLLNKLSWGIFQRKAYQSGMKNILLSLKNYLLKEMQAKKDLS